MRRRLVLLVGAIVPTAALACSSILGLHDLTLLDSGVDAAPEASPSLDAVVESAAPDAGDAAAPCAPALVPAFPPTDDTPDAGDGGVDILLALATIDLGQTAGQYNSNHPIGFDLDGICTCIDDAGSSCTGEPRVCDTAGGRDEAADEILATLSFYEPLSQSGLQQAISAGAFGLLLHIRGYNGLANDQSVSVEYFPSGGTLGAPADAGGPWSVTSASVAEGTSGNYVSNYLDLSAYVNGYVLVSHVTALPLLLVPTIDDQATPISIGLTDVLVAAPLVPADGGSWAIEGGQLEGRWPTSDILYAVRTINAGNGSLCGANGEYTTLAAQICAYADLAVTPQQDNTGASCGALSFAAGFGATPARMGGIYDPPISGVDCPDNWAPTCP